MKFSIVIVAYKAQDKLEKCLNSLAKFPPESKGEIIIVDNSPENLKINPEILDKVFKSYQCVKILRPGSNLGYSAGANYGAQNALGELLVFVNPDTIVYKLWFEQMEKALGASEKVGAVGPISNYVAGLQNDVAHMQPYPDHKKNAEMALKGLSGRYMETDMLIGFFLMTPKQVFMELGGFDPDLFLGCDDLDYSLKLKESGYKMLIATEVYVYHFGHESFKQNPESAKLIKQTENIYIDKLMKKFHGNPPLARDLWGFDMINTQPVKPVKLSVSMIVKNEENNLLDLLPQLDFVDEIVIVDTLKRDYVMTDEVVKSWFIEKGIDVSKVIYAFDEWNDSFSDARNYSLSNCTGDWVLWLDADDRIPEGMGELIRSIIDKPGPLTADKKCHFGFKIVDHGHGTTFTAEQPRLFPRVEGLKWENRVHENYMKSACELGLIYVIAEGVQIEHTGYSDPKLNKQKSERNIRLLKLEPDSGNKFYQLGKEYHSQGDYLNAISNYSKSLDLAEGMEADHIKYSIALSCYQDRGVQFYQYIEPKWLLEGNNKPDATFLLAEYYYFQDQNEKAKELYQKYLSFSEIVDPFGTNQASFKKASEERLRAMV